MTDLEKRIAFILEAEKLKNIYRQTYVIHENRTENDAEHSFHLALMAALLSDYANEPVDCVKVMKMVLVHDIVEIDAGDTYCYDSKGYEDKAERENRAAERIFGLLPDEACSEYRSLWQEFEEGKTAEAKFANALDRIQPLLLNYETQGRSWKEHGISYQKPIERLSPVKAGSERLWKYGKAILARALEEGYLLP